MKTRLRVLPLLIGIWVTSLFAAEGGQEPVKSAVEKARQAASERKIAYKLTTADELKELLGPPLSEKTARDGGMEMLTLQYTDLTARFTRMREFNSPFTVQALAIQGSWLDRMVGQGGRIDIGQDRPVELRTEADLAKFDTFWGFAGVSLGMFSQRPNLEAWKAAVDKASENGILVVTCDPTFLRLATLRRDPNKDMDDPNSYLTARYSHPKADLGVPAGNRATASYHGPEVYTYEVEGGMSWAVPYLAGVAALAFQIDPEIAPAQIMELWTTTATRTKAGPIVNPPKFIEAVRSERDKKRP